MKTGGMPRGGGFRSLPDLFLAFILSETLVQIFLGCLVLYRRGITGSRRPPSRCILLSLAVFTRNIILPDIPPYSWPWLNRRVEKGRSGGAVASR